MGDELAAIRGGVAGSMTSRSRTCASSPSSSNAPARWTASRQIRPRRFGGPSRHRLQCARRALKIFGRRGTSATLAVGAALSALQHGRRKGTHHRDHRTRDAILQAPHWGAFLNLPGAATTPMNELRAVDRYLAFCGQHGTPGGELGSFLAFVNDKKSSMLLRTVRDGLENLLSTAHPAVIVAEQARSLKEAERAARRQPPAKAQRQPRPLKYSVPYEALPLAWKQIFATLLAGRRVRCRKYDPMTVENMVCAVRQLVRSARDARLARRSEPRNGSCL